MGCAWGGVGLGKKKRGPSFWSLQRWERSCGVGGGLGIREGSRGEAAWFVGCCVWGAAVINHAIRTGPDHMLRAHIYRWMSVSSLIYTCILVPTHLGRQQERPGVVVRQRALLAPAGEAVGEDVPQAEVLGGQVLWGVVVLGCGVCCDG